MHLAVQHSDASILMPSAGPHIAASQSAVECKAACLPAIVLPTLSKQHSSKQASCLAFNSTLECSTVWGLTKEDACCFATVLPYSSACQLSGASLTLLGMLVKHTIYIN